MLLLLLEVPYLKPLSKVSPLEVVVSVGVKSKVDKELGQHVCINVCTHTVLHATREFLIVYNDGYKNMKKGTHCPEVSLRQKFKLTNTSRFCIHFVDVFLACVHALDWGRGNGQGGFRNR
jgi:hypothetical protein